ncbi:hypothetical protein DFR38_101173 [Aquitalea magnusonii]|uniref:Uncharacterized protein n=2 Tax=Aquitalea magnusonii TaxID=332411 RepID=A0A318JJ96_9NEIS|nr:hypothetical protein DFR38_101173 [Aquitalea magnusonii]
MDGYDEMGLTEKLRALRRLSKSVRDLIAGNVGMAEDADAVAYNRDCRYSPKVGYVVDL